MHELIMKVMMMRIVMMMENLHSAKGGTGALPPFTELASNEFKKSFVSHDKLTPVSFSIRSFFMVVLTPSTGNPEVMERALTQSGLGMVASTLQIFFAILS
jgi:hypothetical protein